MRVLILLLVTVIGAGVTFAGGELQGKGKRAARPSAEVAELMEHSSAATRALYTASDQMCAAAEHASQKWARLTTPVKPTQDGWGDPMYGHYGKPAHADSPMYVGPSYVASFEAEESAVVVDAEHRAYYRGAYSHPQLAAKTDVSLQPGATHSYMQSGMLMNPGMQAPVYSRAIINNSRY